MYIRNMRRPLPDEYPPSCEMYIDNVRTHNIIKELRDQITDIQPILAAIPEEKEGYAYAPGKWTIKELVGHLTDTERVFSYRAMCFARKDKTPLPGYDENNYVANANFNKQTLLNLGHEFILLRQANMAFFNTLDEEAFDQTGVANNTTVSVRAILFMMAGHTTHHINVLKDKYLSHKPVMQHLKNDTAHINTTI